MAQGKDKGRDVKGAWWVIHESDIMDMLVRAHNGEDPLMLILEAYVDSEHEYE